MQTNSGNWRTFSSDSSSRDRENDPFIFYLNVHVIGMKEE